MREDLGQEQIFGHRQLRHQIEMLMDDGDAEVLRLLRRVQFDRPPFDVDLPLGRAAGPTDRSDQCCLAGAVLAEQGVDFPSADLNVDAVERARPRVFLDQTLDLESDLGVALRKESRPVRHGRDGPGFRRRHAHIPMSSIV